MARRQCHSSEQETLTVPTLSIFFHTYAECKKILLIFFGILHINKNNYMDMVNTLIRHFASKLYISPNLHYIQYRVLEK